MKTIYCAYDEAYTISEIVEETNWCQNCYNEECWGYKLAHKCNYEYCPYCGHKLRED